MLHLWKARCFYDFNGWNWLFPRHFDWPFPIFFVTDCHGLLFSWPLCIYPRYVIVRFKTKDLPVTGKPCVAPCADEQSKKTFQQALSGILCKWKSFCLFLSSHRRRSFCELITVCDAALKSSFFFILPSTNYFWICYIKWTRSYGQVCKVTC